MSVACASLLVIPISASAHTARPATAVKSLQNIPVTGKAQNHKTFTGSFSVDRFVSRQGKTFAVGTLTGNVGQKRIHRSNVAIPTQVQKAAAGTAQSAAACPILHLVLGPVNLNLLGLHVTLGGGTLANQPIVLDITAQSGSGNLLGNLLCGVSNLLNGTGATTPTSGLTAGLLNLVNTLLGTPGLSTL
ncbi:MAG TPA: hypothetical protein VGF93_04250 [Solirubrobacteraceae bacterium]|jgi:hypothetical protein